MWANKGGSFKRVTNRKVVENKNIITIKIPIACSSKNPLTIKINQHKIILTHLNKKQIRYNRIIIQ